MTKAEALERALGYCESLAKSGTHFSFGEGEGFFRIIYGKQRESVCFDYDPPRKAPPKGTIVEVRPNCLDYGVLRFSAGEINAERLCCYCEDPRDGYEYFTDWRVAQPGAELVPMLDYMQTICQRCKNVHSPKYADVCKECKITKPTNYKAETPANNKE